MHPLLNIAERAARAAGNVIVRHVGRIDTLNISSKGLNDFVSEVDVNAERAVVDVIRKAYPSHAILGEETGRDGNSDHVWIIDPLDGTTNFLHGFPHFAVSIAVEVRGRIEHGLVFDPMRHEVFAASRGAGARLDDRRIRVTNNGLAGGLIGTGFPFRDMARLDSYVEGLKSLMTEAAGIRRAGAAALDLAYVAAGRLDGFWEYGLKPWDLAAGALLVREAGGLVTDPRGGEDYMRTGDVVAANPRALKAILARLARAEPRG
ncbi:MAG: inositol monophosphatase [Ectothiorhodospiraceae bacterium]|nr:inositol monophosphatase [Chromatiales bacterium]MCP5157144.1 inositol monophosphatase [Ectothiorhodospiraceae bacterium]